MPWKTIGGVSNPGQVAPGVLLLGVSPTMTDPLDVLIADGVIDEVLGRLKSGKEANISLVRRGEQVLAAKVYKDRSTRSFKNNADYKEGRKVRNSRTQRAMDGGGRFGRDAAEQAWKSAEADALYKLVDSGVRIPTPVMFYEGVLLMELVKDGEGRPAPRLIDVAIEPAAAIGVYADLVAQIIAMLCCDLIHGDLSPYNILAAADGPTIIDLPQVVSAVHNSRAEFFFLRDFDNVVRFVSGFDPALALHRHDGRAIWRAYVARELTREFVPPPPPPPQPPRSGPRRREQRLDDRRPDPRGWGEPARDAARAQRAPQRSNGGARDGWHARPQPDPRRSNGSSPGGPQRDVASSQRDPRVNGAPPGGRPSGWDARSPVDARRSNGSTAEPPGLQGPRSDPPRADSQDRSRAASRPGQPRSPDRSPRDRGSPPPPQRSRSQRAEWSMPAPAAPSPTRSRGRRKRPKRHW
jgi:RIO kinase 1